MLHPGAKYKMWGRVEVEHVKAFVQIFRGAAYIETGSIPPDPTEQRRLTCEPGSLGELSRTGPR